MYLVTASWYTVTNTVFHKTEFKPDHCLELNYNTTITRGKMCGSKLFDDWLGSARMRWEAYSAPQKPKLDLEVGRLGQMMGIGNR